MQQLLFKLQRYNFTIKYKKGKELVTSDALSRLPFIEQTALADVIPLNFLVHLSEISAAALQQKKGAFSSSAVSVTGGNCGAEEL